MRRRILVIPGIGVEVEREFNQLARVERAAMIFTEAKFNACGISGGHAFVPIRDPAGEQFRIISEDLDTLAATRDRNVKLFTVDDGERF